MKHMETVLLKNVFKVLKKLWKKNNIKIKFLNILKADIYI